MEEMKGLRKVGEAEIGIARNSEACGAILKATAHLSWFRAQEQKKRTVDFIWCWALDQGCAKRRGGERRGAEDHVTEMTDREARICWLRSEGKNTDGLGENKGVSRQTPGKTENRSPWQQVQTQAWTRGGRTQRWVTDSLGAVVSGNDQDKVWHRSGALDSQEHRRKSMQMRREGTERPRCLVDCPLRADTGGLKTWVESGPGTSVGLLVCLNKVLTWSRLYLIKDTEGKSIEIIQSKTQRKKRIFEKKWTESQWPGEHDQEFSYPQWGPKGRKGQKGTRTNILRRTGWRFSKSDQKHQPTDSVSSVDPEKHKHKKGTKHFRVKLPKTKHKNLKEAREKMTSYIQENENGNETSHQTPVVRREWNDIFNINNTVPTNNSLSMQNLFSAIIK